MHIRVMPVNSPVNSIEPAFCFPVVAESERFKIFGRSLPS